MGKELNPDNDPLIARWHDLQRRSGIEPTPFDPDELTYEPGSPDISKLSPKAQLSYLFSKAYDEVFMALSKKYEDPAIIETYRTCKNEFELAVEISHDIGIESIRVGLDQACQYMLDHGFDDIPKFEDIRLTEEWRNASSFHNLDE